MNEHIDYLRDKANRLSLSPGVYLMKDKTGKIIYVGKAKALKNRVTSYFRHDANHNAKTLKLIDNIVDFDFIVCPSELDALVLECSLIKLHKPKYNRCSIILRLHFLGSYQRYMLFWMNTSKMYD